MRRVACYSISSSLSANESALDAVHSIVRVVETWLQSKGLASLPDSTASFSLHDGREAAVSVERAVAGTDSAADIRLNEPTDNGRFSTRVSIGSQPSRILVFVELRAGSEALKLRPAPIDTRCPQVLRDILDVREWYTGDTLVRTSSIPFDGVSGGRALMEVVRHVERNLPVVAISTDNGGPLTANIAEDLARDLSGLAIVGTLDDAASWEISQRYGREWSCFNGAIRLYWPLRNTSISAFNHPLWTIERILGNAADRTEGASKLRKQLRRQLLALSTFTIGEPRDLKRIFNDASEQRLRELRESARSVDDWVALADELAAENTFLKVRNAELQNECEQAGAQIENLNLALQYQGRREDETGIAPDSEPVVDTVKDALFAARERLSAELVFGDDVEDGVTTLARDAGPPDKIYEYLKTLAEMTRARRSNGLGKDMMPWLKEQGLRVSGESETVINSATEMQKRTWHDGSNRRSFDKHLKPSEGTSPDRCVRIYFEYDELQQKTIVGWLGRHP